MTGIGQGSKIIGQKQLEWLEISSPSTIQSDFYKHIIGEQNPKEISSAFPSGLSNNIETFFFRYLKKKVIIIIIILIIIIIICFLKHSMEIPSFLHCFCCCCCCFVSNFAARIYI